MIDTRELPVRHSYLKAIAKSPANALEAMAGDADTTTTSRTRGTALHAAVLETARVVTRPDDAPKRPSSSQRNAKKPPPATLDAIAYWDAFDREHANDHILPGAEYDKVMRMAEAVRRTPHAVDVLSGQREVTRHFTYLDRACRGTPDVTGNDWGADLKSTRDAHPDRFHWDARRYGYHAQMAFYREATRLPHWYLVAVEAGATVATCHVVVYRLPEHVLELGERCNRLWMERFLVCEQSGQWPGYAQSIVDLDMPSDDDVPLVFGDDDETDDTTQTERT